MKKVVIYSLLVLFLVHTMGYYLFFELNRYLVRKEAVSVIQTHPGNMMVLSVPDIDSNSEFQRLHKTEFRYRGEMYDVVRESTKGNLTIFVCLHDVKETNLFSGLKNMMQNKVLLVLLDEFNIIQPNSEIDEFAPNCSGMLVFPRINASLKSSWLKTWSPPPEHS